MRLLSTAVSALAIGLLGPAGARADDECLRIHERIVTTFTPCETICFTGTVGPPRLHWTSFFTLQTMQMSANETLYAGKFVLTTPSGSVTLQDSGVLTAMGKFFEIQNVVPGSGTGAFEGATGMLTSQGRAMGSGFAGRLTGTICAREGELSEHGEDPSFDAEDSDE
jgi:hypothetical protein